MVGYDGYLCSSYNLNYRRLTHPTTTTRYFNTLITQVNGR